MWHPQIALAWPGAKKDAKKRRLWPPSLRDLYDFTFAFVCESFNSFPPASFPIHLGRASSRGDDGASERPRQKQSTCVDDSKETKTVELMQRFSSSVILPFRFHFSAKRWEWCLSGWAVEKEGGFYTYSEPWKWIRR